MAATRAQEAREAMAHDLELPDYELLEIVHSSSTSFVYRARRTADGATVAIKRSFGDAPSVRQLTRYLNEYELLGSLAADGIVCVHDLVRHDGHVALVLENCPGVSLRSWIETRAQADLGESLEIARQLAETLAAVHAARIIHKDLNSHNVVYDPERHTAKLVDFGIATRLAAQGSKFQAPASLEGTLAYIAPEQTGRMSRVVDYRADLYSLGVTLYELLTGELPHDNGDPLEIVHFHIAGKPVPPRTRDARIPQAVSDIVMKLLMKEPAHRYQSATGLAADLAACLAALARDGAIEPFELGTGDLLDRFEPSRQLYGRTAETRVLLDSFEHAARGGVAAALVSGTAGSGKTALVQEIYQPITRRRGYFVAGKFDSLERSVPFAALVNAFQELVAQLLTESESAVAAWRNAIQSAVHPYGRLIVDVVPALELIIGAQPPVPEAEAQEAQNRFNVTFQNFVQVFCKKTHPLVLFLDDMQWADPASLNLVSLILSARSTESLLLVMTCRSSELTSVQPFLRGIESQSARGVHVAQIDLAPLEARDVEHFMADALHVEPAAATSLAAVVHEKTAGNPFFMRQFVEELHANGLVRFDAASKAFIYDLAAVRNAAMTENVADLLAAKLVKLPAGTRRALQVAAVLGSTFDLDTLAAACELPPADVAESLNAAVEARLIAPVSQLESLRPDDLGSPLVYRKFVFLHDRVQHAAAAALAEDEGKTLRLNIGRAMLTGAADAREARMFDAVSHLNHASELITDAEERLLLARLNVRAGTKARNATAFDVARRTLRQAVELLGADGWVGERALTFEAHARLAECLVLSADYEAALAILGAALPHAESVAERAQLAMLETSAYVSMGQVARAIDCGRRAAVAVGVALPASPKAVQRQLAAETAAILERTASLGTDQLLELPRMTDAGRLAIMPLLASILPAAYQNDHGLFSLVCCKMVSLSLDHGNCSLSPRAYGSFGGLLASGGERYLEAYRFAKLGVELCRRLDDASSLSGAYFLLGLFAAHWVRPVDESVEHLRLAVQHGLATGDHQHATYGAARVVTQLQFAGAPLEELCAEADAALELLRSMGDEPNEGFLRPRIALFEWLRGERRPDQFAETGYGETQMRAAFRASGNKSFESDRLLTLTMHRYYAGEYSECLELARMSEELIQYSAGFVTRVEHTFFQSLAIAAAHAELKPAERTKLDAVLERNRKLLAGWAELCAPNFEAMHLLVEAERERLRENRLEAMHFYDRAITAARAYGKPYVEGLAAELAARHWVAEGKADFARLYLDAALRAYELWGALGRVADLREAFGLGASGPSTATSTVGTAASTAGERGDPLDLATIIKASQAISGEIVPERLFTKLMDIIVESAGAELGALVLDVDGELVVRSMKASTAKRGAVSVAVPLENHDHVSAGVVHYVLRTREHILLADPAVRSRFRNDPQVRRRQPKSILCAPIVHKGKVTGVIYLENNQVAGAFTPQRLEALNILLAQIAVSIENATLYAQQGEQRLDIEAVNVQLVAEIGERKRAEKELNRYKEHLEVLVRERTKELETAQGRLVALSRRAGMAEVASGVLHNVGNVMNSVNVGASVVRDTVRTMPVERLQRALELLEENAARLPEFLVNDAAGRKLPQYLAKIGEVLAAEKSSLLDALEQLAEHLEHMKTIIAAQQSYAKMGGMAEECSLAEIAESALAISEAALRDAGIEIVREFEPIKPVVADRHQIMQILVNLISNAKHALADCHEHERLLHLSISRDGGDAFIEVRDNGSGISPEHMDRIFTHGFTTKRTGHGFGLHNCANAAQEMGGSLSAYSAGAGQGARFVLKLPARGLAPKRTSEGRRAAAAKR